MITRFLETARQVAPLGIDLWDFLSDARVTDGLTATAYPVGRTGSSVTGKRSPSGVLAFMGLPGLRAAEYPDPDDDSGDFPSQPSADFDIVIRDRRGRFNDTALRITAPLPGLATAADALADCSDAAWSFPDDAQLFLFSAPSRSLPAGTGAIRAQIFGRVIDGADETHVPAAHAVVRVEVAGQQALGIADAAGNALVPVPYPAFGGGFVGSLAESIPAGSHGTPTDDQMWPVTVEVWSQPDALDYPAAAEVPLLGSVLCQGTADIWLDIDDAAPQSELTTDLGYGRDLVLMTANPDDRRELLIDWPAP